MKLWGLQEMENYLTSWATTRFSRRTLFLSLVFGEDKKINFTNRHRVVWRSVNVSQLYSRMSNSRLYWDTSEHDWCLSWFSSVPPENAGLIHYRFLPNSFLFFIHHSLYNSTTNRLRYWQCRRISHAMIQIRKPNNIVRRSVMPKTSSLAQVLTTHQIF
jgi:hypothetical protein